MWGSAGLTDLLTDVDVYDKSTAELMLECKQFHRTIRSLTLAYAVLMQEYLIQFLKWCQNTNVELPLVFWEALEKPEKVYNTDDQQQTCKVFEDMIEDLLKPLLKQSCDWGKSRVVYIHSMDCILGHY